MASARGWPRRALSLVEPWLTLVDDDAEPGARAGRVPDGRPALTGRPSPSSTACGRGTLRTKSIQWLAEDWDTHRACGSCRSASSPTEVTSRGRTGCGVQTSSRLLSAADRDNWRVVPGYRYATADTPEGRDRSTPWRGWVSSTGGRTSGDRSGHVQRQRRGRVRRAASSCEWTPGRSLDRLRARRAVRRDDAAARAEERRHGGCRRGRRRLPVSTRAAQVEVGWRLTDFSDDNARHELFARAPLRVIDVPRLRRPRRPRPLPVHQLRHDGPYFAPERVYATASADLLAEHVTWRRYRRSFVQALGLTAGGRLPGGVRMGRDRRGRVRAPVAVGPVARAVVRDPRRQPRLRRRPAAGLRPRSSR